METCVYLIFLAHSWSVPMNNKMNTLQLWNVIPQALIQFLFFIERSKFVRINKSCETELVLLALAASH